MERLRPEMKEEIMDWKSHFWTPCGKAVEVSDSPILKGEVVLHFSICLDVYNNGLFLGQIFVGKKFYTYAQKNPDANPIGDVHLLRSFLVNLDCQFQDEYNGIFS